MSTAHIVNVLYEMTAWIQVPGSAFLNFTPITQLFLAGIYKLVSSGTQLIFGINFGMIAVALPQVSYSKLKREQRGGINIKFVGLRNRKST